MVTVIVVRGSLIGIESGESCIAYLGANRAEDNRYEAGGDRDPQAGHEQALPEALTVPRVQIIQLRVLTCKEQEEEFVSVIASLRHSLLIRDFDPISSSRELSEGI